MQVKLVEDRLVELGGVRAGTEVEDELDLVLVRIDPCGEYRAFHTGAELHAFEVRGFLRTREIIHGHEVLPPALQFDHEGLPMKPAAPVTMIMGQK